ncbi:MAG: hypothetical protein HOV86_17700, partial [Thermoactinospora sp.]|nr:hypothetical protein [Thermoactinospora sp.]
AIVVSVVAAVVVLVAVIYVAVRLTRPPQGTGAGPTPSLTPTTQPPPSPEIAPTGTALKLPGAPITLTEHASDPIRLASYSVDGGTKLYVRQGRTFVANADYFEYALSPDGKQALATDRDYTTTSYAQVSIVQHATGARKPITLSKAPIYPTTPRWSPDGGTGLVTLYKAEGDTSVAYGFGTIDIATGTVKIFPAKEKGAGEWRYFWAGDDRVATWAGGRMRFYDLDGKLVHSESSVGSPLWVESGTVSPSGEYFLSHCTPAGTAVCAHPVSGGGERITIPLASTRLIGWFGDDHIAGWVADGTGQKAVIVDLRGRVERVLATTTDPVALGKMGLRFTGA